MNAAGLDVSAQVASQALKSDGGNTGQPEIATLTRAMVRGDEAAWVSFHGEYSGRVHRYLLVLLRGDHDTAGELLQVTFTRIAKHIRTFDDEPIFWNWLARIARTVAIDEVRKTGTREKIRRQVETTPTEGEAGEERWAGLLEAGLQELEPDCLALLARKYLQGSTVRDLAMEEGVSEKALESRLVRSREKLRQIMLELVKREA